MPDREKVIKGLECCRIDENRHVHCVDCPYYTDDDKGQMWCSNEINNDALDLLKEQEEKRTPKPIIHGHKEEYWGEEEICPDCGKKWQSEIIDTTHFCPGCGRAVKWE